MYLRPSPVSSVSGSAQNVESLDRVQEWMNGLHTSRCTITRRQMEGRRKQHVGKVLLLWMQQSGVDATGVSASPRLGASRDRALVYMVVQQDGG